MNNGVSFVINYTLHFIFDVLVDFCLLVKPSMVRIILHCYILLCVLSELDGTGIICIE